MSLKYLMLSIALLFATSNSFGQEAPLDDVRYGHYVLPALGGSAGGFMIGAIGAALYLGPSHCDDGYGNSECLDLNVFWAMGVAYLASVAGGVVGTTLAGHDRLRISLITMIGQYATVGGLYYLIDSANNRNRSNGFLFSVAAIYILTTPLITALYAYTIDRSYVKRKARVTIQPVVSAVANRVSYGFSLRF